jgi:hypothetical protein
MAFHELPEFEMANNELFFRAARSTAEVAEIRGLVKRAYQLLAEGHGTKTTMPDRYQLLEQEFLIIRGQAIIAAAVYLDAQANEWGTDTLGTKFFEGNLDQLRTRQKFFVTYAILTRKLPDAQELDKVQRIARVRNVLVHRKPQLLFDVPFYGDTPFQHNLDVIRPALAEVIEFMTKADGIARSVDDQLGSSSDWTRT